MSGAPARLIGSHIVSADESRLRPRLPSPIGLLLDINLDGMSGLELQQHLRTTGSTLPVIVITGTDDPRYEAESRRLGCYAYLHKPCDAGEILDILRSIGDPVDGLGL